MGILMPFGSKFWLNQNEGPFLIHRIVPELQKKAIKRILERIINDNQFIMVSARQKENFKKWPDCFKRNPFSLIHSFSALEEYKRVFWLLN